MPKKKNGKLHLTLRASSGVSGDMMVCGLARLSGLDGSKIGDLINKIGLPELEGVFKIEKTAVGGIAGFRAKVKLAPSHDHRAYRDNKVIIRKSRLPAGAKIIGARAFLLLARAEGAVHGLRPSEVVFHEIGALDSILDICLAAALFDALGPAKFICSPLPLCDGTIRSAHGILSAPSPAALILLEDVPVYGIKSEGETVTPTAAALLKAMGARFGPWPRMTMLRTARVYGGRLLPNVPNGAVFAVGTSFTAL